MSKITLKGFIHSSRSFDGSIRYNFFHFEDAAGSGYSVVGPAEFDYEIPVDFNPISAEISSLVKRREALQDEYMEKAKKISERIADLQCIEHSPEDASSPVAPFSDIDDIPF